MHHVTVWIGSMSFFQRIDWLIDYCLLSGWGYFDTLLQERHHCRWRPKKLRSLLGVNGLSAARLIYSFKNKGIGTSVWWEGVACRARHRQQGNVTSMSTCFNKFGFILLYLFSLEMQIKKHYFRFQKDKINVFMATQNYFDDFDNFHILLSFQKLFRLPPPLPT